MFGSRFRGAAAAWAVHRTTMHTSVAFASDTHPAPTTTARRFSTTLHDVLPKSSPGDNSAPLSSSEEASNDQPDRVTSEQTPDASPTPPLRRFVMIPSALSKPTYHSTYAVAPTDLVLEPLMQHCIASAANGSSPSQMLGAVLPNGGRTAISTTAGAAAEPEPSSTTPALSLFELPIGAFPHVDAPIMPMMPLPASELSSVGSANAPAANVTPVVVGSIPEAPPSPASSTPGAVQVPTTTGGGQPAPGGAYQCSACKKTFRLRSAVEAHINSRHAGAGAQVLDTTTGQVAPPEATTTTMAPSATGATSRTLRPGAAGRGGHAPVTRLPPPQLPPLRIISESEGMSLSDVVATLRGSLAADRYLSSSLKKGANHRASDIPAFEEAELITDRFGSVHTAARRTREGALSSRQTLVTDTSSPFVAAATGPSAAASAAPDRDSVERAQKQRMMATRRREALASFQRRFDRDAVTVDASASDTVAAAPGRATTSVKEAGDADAHTAATAAVGGVANVITATVRVVSTGSIVRGPFLEILVALIDEDDDDSSATSRPPSMTALLPIRVPTDDDIASAWLTALSAGDVCLVRGVLRQHIVCSDDVTRNAVVLLHDESGPQSSSTSEHAVTAGGKYAAGYYAAPCVYVTGHGTLLRLSVGTQGSKGSTTTTAMSTSSK